MKVFQAKYYYEILLIIFCSLIFILTSVYIYKEPNINLVDLRIRDAMYQFRGDKYGFWFIFFRLVTEFGFFYFVGVVALVVAISVRFDRRFWYLCGITVFTYIANELVKIFFLRDRPIKDLQWMTEYSSSYPSGHSMVSIVFYGIIMYYIYDSLFFKKKAKIILISIISILLVLIGLSRMVLGVHYFTDVIGGFALGTIILSTFIILYKAKIRITLIE